jgi:hypothetical protein
MKLVTDLWLRMRGSGIMTSCLVFTLFVSGLMSVKFALQLTGIVMEIRFE